MLFGGAGEGDFLGRLALLCLGCSGVLDLGLGAAGNCLGGDREGLAGLGGAGAGAGAGEGRLLSSDMDLLGAGADILLLSGLLYSNLIASLILALLEAVLAIEVLLALLGDMDLLRVLRFWLPLLMTLFDLSFFLFF